MGIAVKFGINTMSVVLEMGINFTRLRLMKFIPISNTTLVVFIPNFTATHAITSTNTVIEQSMRILRNAQNELFRDQTRDLHTYPFTTKLPLLPAAQFNFTYEISSIHLLSATPNTINFQGT